MIRLRNRLHRGRYSYRLKKATMDELWEAAKVCRMTNVMRPYLESLV